MHILKIGKILFLKEYFDVAALDLGADLRGADRFAEAPKASIYIKQVCFTGSVRTLLDANPPTGKIHPFSKIALTFEPSLNELMTKVVASFRQVC